MPKVTYTTPNGETIVVADAEGTIMSAAVANQVDGIKGDCGGVCSCCTCHVHVDEAWLAQVGPAGDAEEGMLELEDEFQPNSRLGCQIELTPELDGLSVRVVGE